MGRKAKKLERFFLVGSVLLCFFYLRLFGMVAENKSHHNIVSSKDSLHQSLSGNKRGDSIPSTKRIDGSMSSDRGNSTLVVGPNMAKPVFTLKQARASSSLDYSTCCGVGHRLSRMVDAHYLAQKLNVGLRVFFGFCHHQEVYSYLFGSQPLEELQHSVNHSPPNLVYRVKNDVPGFVNIQRKRKATTKAHHNQNATCPCPQERFVEDVKFYDGLRNRFRGQPRVESFRRKHHFHNHTVIGMHVRAGNGEVGDFQHKNRSIQNATAWIHKMAQRVERLSKTFASPPPLLFIATDTASIITEFRAILKDRMPVVDLSQNRPDPGKGVFFGERLSNNMQETSRNATATDVKDDDGAACLEGWISAFADAMVLSHADVVVAARPSSFTQSLPMTLVLSTPKSSRKVAKSFCEVNPTATKMECFESLMDWCCNGTTSFGREGIQGHEYRRMPDGELPIQKIWNQMVVRPRHPEECIPTPKNPQRECLPYDMPDKDRVEEAGRIAVLVDGELKRIRHSGKATVP